MNTRLHDEHREWMEELTLWHNELMFYERIVVRMEAQKNLVPQWNDRLEEFMSKFQTMLKDFDFMREGIQMHERIINASDHDDENVSI
ncbi:MAG: hypothetical protein NTX03_03520 [Bacteroidetes bacterium]|nr:hypothetical protein [Bacteroidota bacterium]